MNDMNGMLELLIPVAKHQYPWLTPDREKMKSTIAACIARPQNLAMVELRGGRITGVLLATSAQHGWARKEIGQILAWVASGLGDALLRECRDWARERQSLRAVGLYMDSDSINDTRISALAERVGFKRKGCAHVWTRSEG